MILFMQARRNGFGQFFSLNQSINPVMHCLLWFILECHTIVIADCVFVVSIKFYKLKISNEIFHYEYSKISGGDWLFITHHQI